MDPFELERTGVWDSKPKEPSENTYWNIDADPLNPSLEWQSPPDLTDLNRILGRIVEPLVVNRTVWADPEAVARDVRKILSYTYWGSGIKLSNRAIEDLTEIAVRHRNLPVLQELLNHGMISPTSEDSMHDLLSAALYTEEVERKPASRFHTAVPFSGSTTKWLIERGSGIAPPHVRAFRSCDMVLETLICEYKHIDPPKLEMLLALGATLNDKALYAALESYHEPPRYGITDWKAGEVLEKLLQSGIDPNMGGCGTMTNLNAPSPLHFVVALCDRAFKDENACIAQLKLLHRYGSLSTILDDQGRTPAQSALARGIPELHEILILFEGDHRSCDICMIKKPDVDVK